MGQSIVKIKDKYLVWSSVVDAPITYGMTRAAVLAWLRDEHGRSSFDYWQRAVAETDADPAEKIKDAIIGNRAGKNEQPINADGVYRRYVELRCGDRGPDSPDDLPEHIIRIDWDANDGCTEAKDWGF